jgi:hypothetical protein
MQCWQHRSEVGVESLHISSSLGYPGGDRGEEVVAMKRPSLLGWTSSAQVRGGHLHHTPRRGGTYRGVWCYFKVVQRAPRRGAAPGRADPGQGRARPVGVGAAEGDGAMSALLTPEVVPRSPAEVPLQRDAYSQDRST